MAQTEMDWPMSLALFSTSDRVKRSEGHRISSVALCPVVGYSCRRSESLSSVALILRTSASSVSRFIINPFQRGHFYFGK
jgi:hypothetical protein